MKGSVLTSNNHTGNHSNRMTFSSLLPLRLTSMLLMEKLYLLTGGTAFCVLFIGLPNISAEQEPLEYSGKNLLVDARLPPDLVETYRNRGFTYDLTYIHIAAIQVILPVSAFTHG